MVPTPFLARRSATQYVRGKSVDLQMPIPLSLTAVLLPSEPKRPVRPSLATDGTDRGLWWMPGTDGGCGVRPDACPGRTVGTAGVLGGATR